MDIKYILVWSEGEDFKYFMKTFRSRQELNECLSLMDSSLVSYYRVISGYILEEREIK